MKGKTQFHYVYKTINLINQKFYYGKHSTTNLNDGYMGSGTYLGRAIQKYGEVNFRTEILKFFKTEEEAYSYEAELVTEELVKDRMCYNLVLGGRGGVTPKGCITEKTRKKLSEAQKGEKNHFYGKIHTEKSRRKIREARVKQEPISKEGRNRISKRMEGVNNPMYNITHPQELLEQIAEKNRNRTKVTDDSIEKAIPNREVEQFLRDNPQFRKGRSNSLKTVSGTKWVNKDNKNKRVPAKDLNYWLSEGWSRGHYNPKIFRLN